MKNSNLATKKEVKEFNETLTLLESATDEFNPSEVIQTEIDTTTKERAQLLQQAFQTGDTDKIANARKEAKTMFQYIEKMKTQLNK